MPMSVRNCYTIALCTASLGAFCPATASSYAVIYNFQGGASGSFPLTPPAADSAGQLYIADDGGIGSYGSVTRLTPPVGPGVAWTETDIYDFYNGGQGSFCNLGPLLVDQTGNIYGNAASFCDSESPQGIAYRLTPSGGSYQFFNLFSSSTIRPVTGMQFGADSQLYGGGYSLPIGPGLLIRLPPLAGSVKYAPAPGGQPSELSPAFMGHLFYTTEQGGNQGLGTIGVVNTSPGKKPSASVIYNFQGGTDAEMPNQYAPAVGSDGKVYGCGLGGAYGLGAVFQLTPPASGQTTWTEAIIYSFSTADAKEASTCSVTAGSAGTLIGSLPAGGPDIGGSVFELAPPSLAGGAWTYKVLHNFNPRKGDLGDLVGAPIRVGNSYFGTAYYGGSANYGGLYEIIP